MATYLQLTNDAIRESGVDLDSLTSGTFTTTTNKLQLKFIAWVAQAYKEIQLSSNSWQWKNKQGTTIIEPRIYVERFTSLSNEGVVGATITGSTSGATAVITSYTALSLSQTWSGGTPFTGYLHLKDYNGQLQFNELLDIGTVGEISCVQITNRGSAYTSAPAVTFSTGTATATATIGTDPQDVNYGKVTSVTITDPGSGYTVPPVVGFVGGGGAGADATAGVGTADFARFVRWGRYNMQGDTDVFPGDILEPDMGSFYIQNSAGYTEGSASFPSGTAPIPEFDTAGEDLSKLSYLKWEEYLRYVESGDGNYGRPVAVTTAPDGTIDFYPKPDKAYVIHYTYTSEPQILSLYSDTPTNMPSEYQDAIFWRAVMHYADYDDKPRIYRNASKRYNFYMNRMSTNMSPPVTWYSGPYIR